MTKEEHDWLVAQHATILEVYVGAIAVAAQLEGIQVPTNKTGLLCLLVDNEAVRQRFIGLMLCVPLQMVSDLGEDVMSHAADGSELCARLKEALGPLKKITEFESIRASLDTAQQILAAQQAAKVIPINPSLN